MDRFYFYAKCVGELHFPYTLKIILAEKNVFDEILVSTDIYM